MLDASMNIVLAVGRVADLSNETKALLENKRVLSVPDAELGKFSK